MATVTRTSRASPAAPQGLKPAGTMKSVAFPPIARPDALILVLGSLPGAMSLAQQRYYAQPYNAFWRIMGALVGAGPDVAYEARLERLRERRIALWDTCHAAERVGSLDAAIVLESVEVNDFGRFLKRHKGIRAIFHNGATSERLYTRLALPHLSPAQQALPRSRLPSTSPAHAGMPFPKKLAAWRAALAPYIELD
jgi:TDG/mug DNA glycosylase family protein